MRLAFAIAAILFVVYTAGTALTQVQPGERAVVRRFGRILPDHPGPGLHIGLPWGIERIDRVPIGNVRRVAVGFREASADDAATPEGQLLTGDHNLVNVQAEIDFIVREEAIDSYALLADLADALVARVAESVLAEWIAGRTVDHALLRGKALLPSVLVDEVNRRLDDYNLGVHVAQASLTRLNPPEDVREAFERVAEAQTNIDTQKYRADQEANRKRQETESELFRLKRSAEAYAKEEVLKATADAQSFLTHLEQYRILSKRQPDYLNVLWQEEMTRFYAKLRANGQVDLLDNYLGAGGINIWQAPPKKK
jgi:membrane protease subunit HflK